MHYSFNGQVSGYLKGVSHQSNQMGLLAMLVYQFRNG
ncbi:hypothetical protein PBAL39_19619 [Pedobacter sp. BAL39]|nr:hypothetical protein PBAL39_19619 [Pedobacter sp. BAL39]